MNVSGARRVASTWVQHQANQINGYQGAYLAGSICWMDDLVEVSPFSDVDIHLVSDATQSGLGKTRHNGVLIEPSIVPLAELQDMPALLRNAAIGSSVWRNYLLDDPIGVLQPVFDYVHAEFAQPARIRERVDVLHQLLRNLQPNSASVSLAQQAMWIVPATRTTHMLLVAALQNPTVRKRFTAARNLVIPEQEDLYERMLASAGLNDISQEESRTWFQKLEQVFDFASGTHSTTSRWKSDISLDARIAAIDGTRNLIESGSHREAMFWVIVTFARAMDVLNQSNDPAGYQQWTPAFEALLQRVGLHSFDAIQKRTSQVHALLPEVRSVAERLIPTS